MKSSVLLDDGGSGKWLCLRTGSESADDDGGAPAAAERCSKAKNSGGKFAWIWSDSTRSGTDSIRSK